MKTVVHGRKQSKENMRIYVKKLKQLSYITISLCAMDEISQRIPKQKETKYQYKRH
jgi:hypothetical protein